MYSTRHLCTVHDTFQDRQFAGATGRLKRYALGLAVRSLDVLQVVGRDAADNLAAFIGSPDNIAVIPNGIDTAAIALDTGVRDLRGELGCGPHDYLIGFFGRFMSQKGFRYLALALRQMLARGSLPRRPLIVAVGGGGFIREEQEWLRSEGLIQHFRFLPFEASIARTLRAMDIVAVPSLWEACPLLPMEAMVAGVPLVGSSCVGLREVLQGGPAVMVPPRDPAALAGALLAAMAEDRATPARAYMAEAAHRFDVAITARALRERLLALAS
jgi:glycosyltransferase involved in cell wall biosynthesis